VKAVDPHGDCLEPLFDVVSVVIVKITAQIMTGEGQPDSHQHRRETLCR